MKLDFHLHSCFSLDGSVSPEDLASHFGCDDVAALTDHETLAGFSRFAGAMAARGARAIAGAEWFLAGDDGHLLTYFRTPPHATLEFMSKRRAEERAANEEAALLLRGRFPTFPPPDRLLALHPHPEGIIGVPALQKEVAALLGGDGDLALRAVREAQHDVEARPTPLEPRSFLPLCKQWSAVTVLAHPFRRRNRRNGAKPPTSAVIERLERLRQLGLDGVEVDGWEVQPDERQVLVDAARSMGLVTTAGSDFHHKQKGLSPGTTEFQRGDLLERL